MSMKSNKTAGPTFWCVERRNRIVGLNMDHSFHAVS